jgi:hypothetical protein
MAFGGKKIRGVKIHVALDKYGIPLAIDVSPANRHDTKGVVPVLRALADGGFQGPALGYRGERLSNTGAALGISVEAIARGRNGRFMPAVARATPRMQTEPILGRSIVFHVHAPCLLLGVTHDSVKKFSKQRASRDHGTQTSHQSKAGRRSQGRCKKARETRDDRGKEVGCDSRSHGRPEEGCRNRDLENRL